MIMNLNPSFVEKLLTIAGSVRVMASSCEMQMSCVGSGKEPFF